MLLLNFCYTLWACYRCLSVFTTVQHKMNTQQCQVLEENKYNYNFSQKDMHGRDMDIDMQK